MFITFEGIDGCGKTTQLKKLADYLTKTGKNVMTIREPGGNKFSESIRELLLDKSNNLSPVTELLLFEAARSHLVETVIKPALSDGVIVLSDRFYDSTTAYQGFGRGLDMDDVIQCNAIATGALKPDITFYLDVPLEVAAQRSGNREKDRIELAGNSFFERVRLGFRELAKMESHRIIQIDATRTAEETFAIILSHLQGRF
jgi:dTMP kinase